MSPTPSPSPDPAALAATICRVTWAVRGRRHWDGVLYDQYRPDRRLRVRCVNGRAVEISVESFPPPGAQADAKKP